VREQHRRVDHRERGDSPPSVRGAQVDEQIHRRETEQKEEGVLPRLLRVRDRVAIDGKQERRQQADAPAAERATEAIDEHDRSDATQRREEAQPRLGCVRAEAGPQIQQHEVERRVDVDAPQPIDHIGGTALDDAPGPRLVEPKTFAAEAV